MCKVGLSALVAAGLIAVGFLNPAHASTLTYDITLTQTSGSLISGSPPADFMVTTTFTVQAPTSNFQQETTSNFSFTIAGQTYTSDLTLQFSSFAPPVISSYYGFSSTSGLDTLSIGGGNSFNLSGSNISMTDGGTVTFALAATPLPTTLPLFAGGLVLIGYLTKCRKRNAKQAFAAA